jgi:penicillin-binding protein 1A
MNKKNPKKNIGFQFVAWIWLAIHAPLILFWLILSLSSLGVFGSLPSFEELENPRFNLASLIYSSDKKLIGRYYVENRVNIGFNEIPKDLVSALVSTEDERYYQHSGVDIRALGRVVKGIVTGRSGSTGGGSTISQQLAKLLFSEKPKNKLSRVMQKFKEWVISFRLERNYTKEEILAMYLNRADFGRQSFGVKSAARVYFGKSPEDLKLVESASLVGMLQAPTAYDPLRREERHLKRRNVVLGQMLKNKKIDQNQFDSLKIEPVIQDREALQERIKKNQFGQGELAPYFVSEMRKDLDLWCKQNLNPNSGKPYNLFTDGLRIHTTLDSRIQEYAESAVETHMKELQTNFYKKRGGRKNAPFSNTLSESAVDDIIWKAMQNSDRYRNLKSKGLNESEIRADFNTPVDMTIFTWNGEVDTVMTPRDSVIHYRWFLQTGLVAIDPHNGFVKAWVGGINYRHFKYDHVRAGKVRDDGQAIVPGGGRQVGSTFKPFVYALAMEEGRSPCELVPNVKVCIEDGLDKPWCPRNSGEYKEGQMVSLREALAYSINYVSALLMKQYGPHAVAQMAKRLGISAPIEPLPSICLGTPDISVFEMTSAFSTFFNRGVRVSPMFITRIEDKNGNMLAQFAPERKEVMSEKTAYLTVQLLKGVVLQGTAQRLRGQYRFTEPVAGKTGTTQNNSDGWFMGGTPDLVVGVWTGAEDRSVHFPSTADGQGARMAMPIFGLMMRKVYDDKRIPLNRGDFPAPEGMFIDGFNCQEVLGIETLYDNPYEVSNFD